MPRFFGAQINGETALITGEDAAHISKSLRMKPGESLTLCDTAGTDYDCVITSLSSSQVALKILEAKKCDTEPNINVTLFQCLPKSDKMDKIIKQSVELGVCKIVPVISERCVSRPDKKSSLSKIARFQKISLEAAKQCGRGIIPQIMPFIALSKLAEFSGEFDHIFFFYECGGNSLRDIELKGDNFAIVTGSEGGFSKLEAEFLIKSGATPISLGRRILRAETAPLAALSSLMLITGNLE